MVTDFKIIIPFDFIFKRFQEVHNHFDDFSAAGANQMMVLVVFFMEIQFIANTPIVQAELGEDSHFAEQKECPINRCQSDFWAAYFYKIVDFFCGQVFPDVLHDGIEYSPALGSEFVALLLQAFFKLICNNNDTSFSLK